MPSATPALTVGLVAQFVPLNALRADSQRDLAKKSRLVPFKAGQYLFQIGDKSHESLFLVEGTVLLESSQGQLLGKVQSGQSSGKHPIANQFPRMVNARAESDALVLVVDAAMLDVMLTWDQTGRFELEEVQDTDDAESDWMTKLLQLPAFQAIPPTNLQAIFLRMQETTAEPGQVIIKQGDVGDYFYVLIEGRCMVTREAPNQKNIRLAELEQGSCFGEEALISDGVRNANVIMLTRGKLMRLGKNDFRALLTAPLHRSLSLATAQEWASSGKARLVDVRMPTEYQNHHLPNSTNVPLFMLRARLAVLDSDVPLILCCDTGRRSSVATFVLTQKGFDTYILEGGVPTHLPA